MEFGHSNQSLTTPTRTAIIFTSEPVFAAATSYLVDGEILSGSALAGAALIVVGMLVAELPAAWTQPGRSDRASPPDGAAAT